MLQLDKALHGMALEVDDAPREHQIGHVPLQMPDVERMDEVGRRTFHNFALGIPDTVDVTTLEHDLHHGFLFHVQRHLHQLMIKRGTHTQDRKENEKTGTRIETTSAREITG